MVLQLISKFAVDFSGSCVVGGIGSVVSTKLAVLPLSWFGGVLKAGGWSLEVVGDASESGGMEREGLRSKFVVGDAAVTSCDALRSLSPLEASEVSGVVRGVAMGSEGGGMDWQVVGTGWGSFSTVAVSVIPITSSFNHFFRNKASTNAQSCFSCCGNSSYHSSASLSACR